jgi:hypothetical protein
MVGFLKAALQQLENAEQLHKKADINIVSAQIHYLQSVESLDRALGEERNNPDIIRGINILKSRIQQILTRFQAVLRNHQVRTLDDVNINQIGGRESKGYALDNITGQEREYIRFFPIGEEDGVSVGKMCVQKAQLLNNYGLKIINEYFFLFRYR